jgi:RNA polymerase sigma factor (sigma-70 family)
MALLTPDEDAQFFEFHAKTSAGLFRKAFRMCQGHEADARDALQEAYLKALDNWVIVGGLTDSQRHGWIARTLTNEILQMWRRPHRSREAGAPDEDAAPHGWTDAADAAHHKDTLRRTCQAISQIGRRPGEVVALYYLGGYEMTEIAELLGITTATVRVHLHTGRMRFWELLGGAEGAGHDVA